MSKSDFAMQVEKAAFAKTLAGTMPTNRFSGWIINELRLPAFSSGFPECQTHLPFDAKAVTQC